MSKPVKDTVTITYCEICALPIGDTGLCSYACQFDGDNTEDRPTFSKTYERTMKEVATPEGPKIPQRNRGNKSA